MTSGDLGTIRHNCCVSHMSCVGCVRCFPLHRYCCSEPGWLLWHCGGAWVKKQQANSSAFSYINNPWLSKTKQINDAVNFSRLSNERTRIRSPHLSSRAPPVVSLPTTTTPRPADSIRIDPSHDVCLPLTVDLPESSQNDFDDLPPSYSMAVLQCPPEYSKAWRKFNSENHLPMSACRIVWDI